MTAVEQLLNITIMQVKHLRHKSFPFRPSKAALLVIDVQKYFTSKKSHAYISSASRIITRINKLVSAFAGAGCPVIFTRHIDFNKNSLMIRWWKERIERRNPLSQLDERLDTSRGKIIIKNRYDAFMGTQLEGMLKKMGVQQVTITGVVAHLCCETTARSAFMRNFETFFVTDCVASYKTAYERATILNLAHGFAIPVNHLELLKKF